MLVYLLISLWFYFFSALSSTELNKQNMFNKLECCSSGLGICSSVFRANRSFSPKNEQMSDSLKKNERFTHLLIFGERPERFAHDRSFPLSDLSESLMVAHFWWVTWAICSHRSFLVSNLSDLLTSLILLSDLSDSLTLLTKKEEINDSLIFSIKKIV